MGSDCVNNLIGLPQSGKRVCHGDVRPHIWGNFRAGSRWDPPKSDGIPNRILLVTIYHMIYPITENVLHQVFSPHGFVVKIVTSQKSAGLQALIQYDLHHSAISARNFLQGRYIYDGCCQLDIEFSTFDAHDITVPTTTVQCKTENRHNAHEAHDVDYTEDVKNLSTTDIAHMKDVIVDVCDVDEPIPQSTQVEVPDMVVFLNKELTELNNDLEVREFLTSFEVPGDDIPIVCGSASELEVVMASPKIKSIENESVDTFYKLEGPTMIIIAERLNPNVIYFLSYTLRTRWFLKRGRMLWIRAGQQGRGPKSGRRVETRSRESKRLSWHQLMYFIV
ncbi:hypothetical protein CASFOL_029281 [Castilleja foliolosa]|uniref:PTBP1-like RNA recognition motif 2 domain-containing protein n=1 Tax=Castilleja foliolosa TaxID=1961234 RepID=A0ABD3CCT3_9LAMI